MSKTYIHNGRIEDVPADASPGLLFLKDYLPASDSLGPSPHPVSRFLAEDATYMVNSNIPAMKSQVIPMLELRKKHASKFRHEIHTAWDIEHDHDGPGHDGEGTDSGANTNRKRTRTVMYEATSETVFKQDPEQFEVRIREFNILELAADESGPHGLIVVEVRTFMDARPIQDRAGKLQSQFAQGAA